MTKRLAAVLLALTMVFGVVTPATVQAATKATVKTVKGVKFTKSKSDAKQKYDYTQDTAVVGSRIMLVKHIKDGKDVLLTTKNGKTFSKVNLQPVILKHAGYKKTKGKEVAIDGILQGSKVVIVYGTIYDSKTYKKITYVIKTKNGKKFFGYTKIPTLTRDYFSGKLLRAAGKYVWIYNWTECEDSCKENKTKKTFVMKYKFFVSKDLKKWSSHYVTFSGTLKNKLHVFKDAKRKTNHFMTMYDPKGDSKYLYVSAHFMPYDEGGFEDPGEEYVFRSKDFKHFEKIDTASSGLIGKMKHYEDVLFTRPGRQYATSIDWGVNNKDYSYYVGGFSFAYAEKPGAKMKKIFTYNPKKYKGKTTNAWANWNANGKNVSLFFEREKQSSLFVSTNGISGFKEYTTDIKLSKCSTVCSDEKRGYKIIVYDDMKYLLFSKNGFVTTYKVKLPAKAQDFEWNNSTMVITTKQGHYYISLAALYKKLK